MPDLPYVVSYSANDIKEDKANGKKFLLREGILWTFVMNRQDNFVLNANPQTVEEFVAFCLKDHLKQRNWPRPMENYIFCVGRDIHRYTLFTREISSHWLIPALLLLQES